MIRLTDLRGNCYYVTEEDIPTSYQRGDEFVDVVDYVADVMAGDWIACFADRILLDKVAVRADQIYRAEEA